jgi:hypothetical protein
MTNAVSELEVRTYAGWRRVRGLELLGLTAPGLVIVAASVALALAAALLVSVPAMVLCAAVTAPLVAVAVARRDGEPLLRVIARRVRWAHGTARGWTMLRGQDVTDWTLPGPLAATKLVNATSAAGQPFGVVWDRASGRLTATLRCAATSTALVDPRESDGWVSNWHSWLAGLGYLPTVAWVNVTVDTAPDPGSTLHDYVNDRLAQAPDSPADARTLLRDLVAASPGAAADVDTRVSVTFDPAAEQGGAPSPRLVAGRWLMAQFGVRRGTGWTPDLGEQLAAVDRDLTGLESSLPGCGVSVLGRATAADLAGIVRTAYDPQARGDVARALEADPDSLAWETAGAVGADESWAHYRHDTGWSVTYAWVAPPGQEVTSAVLHPLLGPGRFPKRVTMLYRARSAADAAAELERQVNLAAFREARRRAQGRDETARDREDRAAAHRAAAEEARGAGVVLMSMYVTVTVTEEDQLRAAMSEVEARARHSKIRLRVLTGSQAAGFTATLPAGVHPVALARARA